MNTNVDSYDDGHLRVEHDNYYIACRGERLQLPRKEFLIVSRLARNVERIVAAEEIWRAGWGASAEFNAVITSQSRRWLAWAIVSAHKTNHLHHEATTTRFWLLRRVSIVRARDVGWL